MLFLLFLDCVKNAFDGLPHIVRETLVGDFLTGCFQVLHLVTGEVHYQRGVFFHVPFDALGFRVFFEPYGFTFILRDLNLAEDAFLRVEVFETAFFGKECLNLKPVFD